MTPPPAGTLTAPASQRPATVAPAPVQVQALSLIEPMPGFPGFRDFVLVPAEAGGRLFWLQSVAPEGPRFLTVPAPAYFPDYAPVLPSALCAELGLASPSEARCFCVVTVPAGDVASATANLRAPVVVNPATHRARQVVLLDATQPIRHPIGRPVRR